MPCEFRLVSLSHPLRRPFVERLWILCTGCLVTVWCFVKGRLSVFHYSYPIIEKYGWKVLDLAFLEFAWNYNWFLAVFRTLIFSFPAKCAVPFSNKTARVYNTKLVQNTAWKTRTSKPLTKGMGVEQMVWEGIVLQLFRILLICRGLIFVYVMNFIY